MFLKLKTIAITVISIVTLGILQCAEKDDSQDETTAVLVLAAAALSQRPAFSFACNRSGGSGYCENNYGSGQTQTQCVSAGGTVQTTRCTGTSNVGMCTYSATSVRYVEKVYYSGTFSAGTASSDCTALLGTFASTYTQ